MATTRVTLFVGVGALNLDVTDDQLRKLTVGMVEVQGAAGERTFVNPSSVDAAIIELVEQRPSGLVIAQPGLPQTKA